MPTCKYCHHTISNFDKDVCPYCGEKNPIDNSYETKDMTQFVNPVTGDFKLYKSKSRMIASFLCLFLGSFGAHCFYLGFVKKGLSELFITLAFVGGFGSLLGFVWFSSLPLPLMYLTAFSLVFIAYAIFSIRYFTKDSLKDSRGEFLH